MAAKLKTVDATKKPGFVRRVFAAVAANRLWLFFSRHVSWKLDPILLRATGGRVASSFVFPTGVLETRGAKSGARRRNAIIYFRDGKRVVIVPSNAGRPNHPAWYYNLLANPDVSFNGLSMRAAVVDDEAERQRLWVDADRVFPAFATYRRRAAAVNRTIPIVQLTQRQ